MLGVVSRIREPQNGGVSFDLAFWTKSISRHEATGNNIIGWYFCYVGESNHPRVS